MSGKIDRIAHSVAIGSALLSLIYFGFPMVNFYLCIPFIVADFFDNLGNDVFIDKKKNVNLIFKSIFRYRLLIDITAFIVSIILGVWIIFFIMICCDIGYQLVSILIKRKEVKEG